MRSGRCGWAPSGTDQVVESHKIACSHFDAFRFFTSPARPLNVLQPTRESQPTLEQGGCLHANMDLYKWAGKLMPFTPSALVLDCFELARDIRTLDMRASPYDLSALGYPAVAIETSGGQGRVRVRPTGLRPARPPSPRTTRGPLRPTPRLTSASWERSSPSH
jgi:hypothetical protein